MRLMELLRNIAGAPLFADGPEVAPDVRCCTGGLSAFKCCVFSPSGSTQDVLSDKSQLSTPKIPTQAPFTVQRLMLWSTLEVRCKPCKGRRRWTGLFAIFSRPSRGAHTLTASPSSRADNQRTAHQQATWPAPTTTATWCRADSRPTFSSRCPKKISSAASA